MNCSNTQKNLFLRPLVIIIGPTGVGKSAFAEELGKKLPIHIVNGDMGQFYFPLTIGTAKPAWKESRIPHHFFDIFPVPYSYSAIEYRNALEAFLESLSENDNRIPVIVGGSTFYIWSLFFASIKDEVNKSKRESAESLCKAIPDQECWHALNAIDSIRASQIHHHDIYRVRRALMQWYMYEKQPSLLKHQYAPLASEIYLVHLDKPKMVLRESLEKRIRLMLANGWLKEVEDLLYSPWREFWKIKGFIGYEEIAQFIETGKEHEHEEALIKTITIRTEQYVKKQATFWRMLRRSLEQESSEIKYFYNDLTLSIPDLYINQLCGLLK